MHDYNIILYQKRIYTDSYRFVMPTSEGWKRYIIHANNEYKIYECQCNEFRNMYLGDCKRTGKSTDTIH